jgi:site-specific recombinase XerD
MKEDRTMPEPFTQDEVALIFARENNRKHLLVLQVAYYGGVRLSDIRFLRVRDIRFDRGLIHLEVGKGRKDRYATFPDILHETMRGHISGMAGNDFVFTPNGSKEPYPKRTIQKISENACLRAGIDGRSNMHRFRHSAATHMVQNGVNLRIIQEILGHASPKTTMLYTRVAAQDIANVRNALVRVECTKVS